MLHSERALTAFDAGTRLFGSRAEPIRLDSHGAILGGGVVVPTEEMEQAVGEEHRDLVERRTPGLFGLGTRRRHAHDDVAEQTRNAGRRPSWQTATFAHREGKNVGRPIFFSIEPVQLLDLIVTGKEN